VSDAHDVAALDAPPAVVDAPEPDAPEPGGVELVDDRDGLSIHRVDGDVLAERAVALLADRLAEGGAPRDSAVLARVNSALLPVQVALTEAGIAHTAPLDASVLGRTGIRTALAYLRLGLDIDRIARDDLFDTINRPARKVKSAVTPLLRGRGARFSIGQLEQVADSLEGQHRDRFTGYLGDLHHLSAAITEGADTARCLWIVRNRIGLGEAMDALDASRTRPEGSSHGDDLDALEQLAALHPDPSTFRTWLADRLRVPADPDGVTLSTIHRVKGLEWPHVVVFAANQGLFPHRLADDVEEERRVFHVAVTRCSDRVQVLADRARTSPFVDELRTTATTRPARRPDETVPDARPPSRHADGRLVAERGVEVTVAGGVTGTVVQATRQAVEVVAEVDGDRLRLWLPVGERVRVEGAEVTLGPPAPRGGPRSDGGAEAGRGSEGGLLGADADGSGGGEEPDPELFEALRAWRSRVAAEHGVPAYLVFHDRHLQQLATRKPTTLSALARCEGVGPTKLERYGDDVLAIVDAHRPS
jgi:hypothetical protein